MLSIKGELMLLINSPVIAKYVRKHAFVVRLYCVVRHAPFDLSASICVSGFRMKGACSNACSGLSTRNLY